MHFLINPGGRKSHRRRRTRARANAGKRRRRNRHGITLTRGTNMARRRRRRRHAALRTNRRRRRHHVRRRRSNPGALAAARLHNPRRRRRRRFANARRRHVRRRYRNPLLPTGGIVGGIVQGLKDGAAVVGGQVAARKISGAVTGMLPSTMQANVTTGMGKIALSIVSAVATSLIARKALPGQARLITAGAFSETINCALAQTPIAPFLSAYPLRRTNPRLAAYPGTGSSRLIAAAPRVAAYPGTMRVVGMPSHIS